jgi:threonine/homoserine/homoserine lactone efflux protein
VSAAVDASYLAYLSFTFILVVTPGSTTAVVVRNTLEGGRRAGYATALGAAFANTFHATAAGLGLSLLVAYWPGSLEVAGLGGAAFLAWLGLNSLVRAWRTSDGGINFSLAPKHPIDLSAHHKNARDGLAINMLSPAIISFYLAIVPSFIPAGSTRWYYVMLSATHVTMAFVVHSMWATGLDLLRRWFAPPWTRRLLQALTGVALLTLALRVLA